MGFGWFLVIFLGLPAGFPTPPGPSLESVFLLPCVPGVFLPSWFGLFPGLLCLVRPFLFFLCSGFVCSFVSFGSRCWSLALSLFDYTTAAVNVRTASRKISGRVSVDRHLPVGLVSKRPASPPGRRATSKMLEVVGIALREQKSKSS